MLKTAPESVVWINLEILQQLGLLHYHSRKNENPYLTRYFQVIENSEKITLLNNEFVIWIAPEKEKERTRTITFIALNHPEGPNLELTFITTGVYNTSRLVLRILEKFLFDIQENEDALKHIKKVS